MSKQPNRQRCQPKIYTDSDFRKALREAVSIDLLKHFVPVCEEAVRV